MGRGVEFEFKFRAEVIIGATEAEAATVVAWTTFCKVKFVDVFHVDCR